MPLTLGELARLIDASLDPAHAADRPIIGCATLADATDQHISFLANPRYLPLLKSTRAAAVILQPDAPAGHFARLIATDPYFAFRQAMQLFYQVPLAPGVHPSAVVDPSATIGPGSRIAPHCVIEAHASLGRDCILGPNVTIYHHCTLGDRVTLAAGCVIGVDGFGYATHQGQHHKIPPAGNAIIEDDVEMGAHCIVERATLGSTRIGRGTKFADAVVIGHGSIVGSFNLFVSQVGLAGSVTTGDHVAIGGQSGIAGHLKIGDRAQIAAHSGVMTDVPADAKFGGTPAIDLADAKRLHLFSRQLPDFHQRLKKLERHQSD